MHLASFLDLILCHVLIRDLSNNKIDAIADDAFEGLDNLEDV